MEEMSQQQFSCESGRLKAGGDRDCPFFARTAWKSCCFPTALTQLFKLYDRFDLWAEEGCGR